MTTVTLRMTPEYAKTLAKRAGCTVHCETSRGVEWLVMTGDLGVESVPVWYLFQMTEFEFRKWYLSRAVGATG